MLEALEGVCLTHHCPSRIRNDWLRSEALGAALEAGTDLPGGEHRPARFPLVTRLKANVVTGELELVTEAA